MRGARDVVLIHGLVNRHRWSDAFLETVADSWGSGHVYVIYTNESNDVQKKVYNGNVIYTIGIILKVRKAFTNTNPKWLRIFNTWYPVVGAPFTMEGKCIRSAETPKENSGIIRER